MNEILTKKEDGTIEITKTEVVERSVIETRLSDLRRNRDEIQASLDIVNAEIAKCEAVLEQK